MVDENIRLLHASGECEIDLARRELRVLGSPVPVGGRAFEIIEILARSAGEIVTKDELMNRIWPGAIVTENTLFFHAAAIRKALGPHRGLLKTEVGRGYRLLGDWTVRRHDAARPSAGQHRMRADGDTPATNIPATVTALVGRTAALEKLRDVVSAYRVVTLTGPGGIGKTSLALEAARRVAGEFADGGWLVELASLSDSSLAPTAVAHALKLPTGPDSITADFVARAIGRKKLLLVLDNCEHLIGAIASLAETLLTLCAHITIVATSREILRIQGEYVYRVPPLEVPALGQDDADQILSHSAVQLFIARTKASGAGFAPRADELPSIGAICRRLDGIPLAIEFAAAGAAALAIQQLADGLHDRFALLTRGRRTALPRHRTLRAVLDWSYELLPETEQRLLRQLAIFAGGFTSEAAIAVANDGVAHPSEVIEGIAALVTKSLVTLDRDGVSRWYLLETIRAYSFDRLTESSALADAARRHAAYLLKVLGSLEAEARSKPSDEYLIGFRRNADEIDVALDWAFSANGDPDIGVALAIASAPLWFELSRLAVAHRRLEQALPHAEIGSEQEMWLLLAYGHALWYLGPGGNNADAMEPAFTRALAIADQRGVTVVRTRALWGMWAVQRGRGNYRNALEIADQYMGAATSAGDLAAMHLADRILGLTHYAMGHQPIAREFTERALRQPRLLSSASGIGYQVETPVAMRAQLARILWLMGFPDQAMAAMREALEAAENSGQSYPICYAVWWDGQVALWTGAAGEARRQLDLLVAHSYGNQRWVEWARCFERVLKLRNGNEAEALIAAFSEARWDTGGGTTIRQSGARREHRCADAWRRASRRELGHARAAARRRRVDALARRAQCRRGR
jgi:predicted ATPase/DNA-binding winged helix-turn-helix (wHTH) protein